MIGICIIYREIKAGDIHARFYTSSIVLFNFDIGIKTKKQ
jgi:hypothetical protein